jgi:hypothetical protein
VGCLAGIVATWVAMAEILQSVQEKGGNSYNKVPPMSSCVCVCVRARARVCVRACVCVRSVCRVCVL